MSTHGTRSSREVFAGSAMAFRALGYRLWPGKLAWIGFEIGFLGPPIIDFAQKIGFVLQFSVSDRAPNRPWVRLPSHSGAKYANCVQSSSVKRAAPCARLSRRHEP